MWLGLAEGREPQKAAPSAPWRLAEWESRKAYDEMKQTAKTMPDPCMGGMDLKVEIGFPHQLTQVQWVLKQARRERQEAECTEGQQRKRTVEARG